MSCPWYNPWCKRSNGFAVIQEKKQEIKAIKKEIKALKKDSKKCKDCK